MFWVKRIEEMQGNKKIIRKKLIVTKKKSKN